MAVMQAFLEEEQRDGLIQGGKVATERDQIAEVWRLRESISVALNKAGGAFVSTTCFSHCPATNISLNDLPLLSIRSSIGFVVSSPA